jgi:hypothetical protein
LPPRRAPTEVEGGDFVGYIAERTYPVKMTFGLFFGPNVNVLYEHQ